MEARPPAEAVPIHDLLFLPDGYQPSDSDSESAGSESGWSSESELTATSSVFERSDSESACSESGWSSESELTASSVFESDSSRSDSDDHLDDPHGLYCGDASDAEWDSFGAPALVDQPARWMWTPDEEQHSWASPSSTTTMAWSSASSSAYERPAVVDFSTVEGTSRASRASRAFVKAEYVAADAWQTTGGVEAVLAPPHVAPPPAAAQPVHSAPEVPAQSYELDGTMTMPSIIAQLTQPGGPGAMGRHLGTGRYILDSHSADRVCQMAERLLLDATHEFAPRPEQCPGGSLIYRESPKQRRMGKKADALDIWVNSGGQKGSKLWPGEAPRLRAGLPTQGGHPAPLAARLHRFPTHFLLNLHGIMESNENDLPLAPPG